MQEQFLQGLKDSGCSVKLTLLNGVRLEGKVLSFDRFCIKFIGNGCTQIVYKHGLSTICRTDKKYNRRINDV